MFDCNGIIIYDDMTNSEFLRNSNRTYSVIVERAILEPKYCGYCNKECVKVSAICRQLTLVADGCATLLVAVAGRAPHTLYLPPPGIQPTRRAGNRAGDTQLNRRHRFIVPVRMVANLWPEARKPCARCTLHNIAHIPHHLGEIDDKQAS